MPTIDELYWEDYVDLMEAETTLEVIEPPYINKRRVPGFGREKRRLRKPQTKKAK